MKNEDSVTVGLYMQSEVFGLKYNYIISSDQTYDLLDCLMIV